MIINRIAPDCSILLFWHFMVQNLSTEPHSAKYGQTQFDCQADKSGLDTFSLVSVQEGSLSH